MTRTRERKRPRQVGDEALCTQAREGRYFLFEHPKTATPWMMPEVEKVARMDDVDIVKLDMCATDTTDTVTTPDTTNLLGVLWINLIKRIQSIKCIIPILQIYRY